MNQKALRYAFSQVLAAAEVLSCKDLYHQQKDKHAPEYVCPAEYRLSRQIHLVREYAEKEFGKKLTSDKTGV